jgi:hypothetical protein
MMPRAKKPAIPVLNENFVEVVAFGADGASSPRVLIYFGEIAAVVEGGGDEVYIWLRGNANVIRAKMEYERIMAAWMRWMGGE